MQSVNKSHCQEPIGLQGESVFIKNGYGANHIFSLGDSWLCRLTQKLLEILSKPTTTYSMLSIRSTSFKPVLKTFRGLRVPQMNN